jgi:hypothetical protein
MRPSRIVGIILIVIGIIAMAYGWFGSVNYTTRENVAKLGPLEVNQEKEHRIPVAPIAGGILIVGGVILLASGGRQVP